MRGRHCQPTACARSQICAVRSRPARIARAALSLCPPLCLGHTLWQAPSQATQDANAAEQARAPWGRCATASAAAFAPPSGSHSKHLRASLAILVWKLRLALEEARARQARGACVLFQAGNAFQLLDTTRCGPGKHSCTRGHGSTGVPCARSTPEPARRCALPACLPITCALVCRSCHSTGNLTVAAARSILFDQRVEELAAKAVAAIGGRFNGVHLRRAAACGWQATNKHHKRSPLALLLAPASGTALSQSRCPPTHSPHPAPIRLPAG